MPEFNQKEYQTVVLGALLHDVGKMLQRAELEKEYPGIKDNYDLFCPLNERTQFGYLHAAHTAFFIDKYIPDGLFDKTELYNAARHHKNAFGDLYKEADILASGMERYDKESDEDTYKTTRLHSIFDVVELQYKIRKDNKFNSRWRHKLIPFSEASLTDLFPVFSDDKKANQDNEKMTYRTLWNSFSRELSEISDVRNQQCYFDELYWLLEKYTWCIPSATNVFSDISLFDHCKATAAIASSLYLFRQENEKSKSEFLLYAGDISGIQDYIFKISQVQGIGGIARRLRGRSFYIVMMAETLARHIANRFSLSQANINFCGGGNFELLLPNTKEVCIFINEFEKEINGWLLEQFHGDLGFVAAFIEMSATDLKERFGKMKDALGDRLTEAKQKKYHTHLESDSFWVDGIKRDGQITVCKSCNLNLVGTEVTVCEQCELDRDIGTFLPKAEFITFSAGAQPHNEDCLTISFGNFGNILIWDKDSRLKLLGNTYALEESVSQVKAKYWLSRTLPIATKLIQELETEKDENENMIVNKGQTLSFATLAEMAQGDKRIGILKMDVDNLGLIFSMGLDVPPTGKEDIKDLRTVSRLATLSRQLTVFFTAQVDAICHKVFENWKADEKVKWQYKDAVSNIFYLIFSGGDDLLVVGPWDRVIELATEIRKEFKEFTCHNPNITISAGIYICKPKFPISIAVKKAEEALKQSKDRGRNRITVMGKTDVWAVEDERSRIYQDELKKEYSQFTRHEIQSEKIYLKDEKDKREFESLTFEELTGFADKLERWLKEEVISRGFIQRLLAANEKFFPQSYDDHKERFEEIHDMNVIPHMIYNIERNVKKGGKKDVKEYLITNGDVIKAIRQAYYPCKQVLMKTRK